MLPSLLCLYLWFLESILNYIHCSSPYPTNRHPETLPAIMSPLYVVGMLGLLMKISAPMCAPTEYTIYFERQECNYCVAVNTTICMGFCFSRVSRQCEDRKCFVETVQHAVWQKTIYLSPFTHTHAKHVTSLFCGTQMRFFHFILCSTE